MKPYIVTGGAGFIGSCLVRALLERGDGRVVVIDNLVTGSETNIRAVSHDLDFHNADIRDHASIARLIDGADTVFHLAAIPSVLRSIDDPEPSHSVNLNGTFNVLRACREGGVRRVVYASSSAVYGDSKALPASESALPCPKSPYAIQKLAGEHYCAVFTSCYGLETVSLRFFNVYGPRQDPSSPYSGVLPIFMNALIQRRAPTIFGDGEQSRDFTYVQDVVGLAIKAAFASRVSGHVYNAGKGGRYTLNHVWSLLQKIEGVPLAAKYGPPRAGDIQASQADTTAAQRDLCHAPWFTLEEGLRRTLEWYKDRHVWADSPHEPER